MDSGNLALDGQPVPKDNLAYLPVGHGSLTLVAGSEGARVLLIGGEPLGEKIVMWWNFVGRSHEEIVAYRTQWQSEIGADAALRTVRGTGTPALRAPAAEHPTCGSVRSRPAAPPLSRPRPCRMPASGPAADLSIPAGPYWQAPPALHP